MCLCEVCACVCECACACVRCVHVFVSVHVFVRQVWCTFQDLMHACVPHVLLHSVVLQVAVAAVHLQRCIADLCTRDSVRRHTPHAPISSLTSKHLSVAKSLAMAHSATWLGAQSSRACAARCTRSLEATRSVAISASLNCRYCKQTG